VWPRSVRTRAHKRYMAYGAIIWILYVRMYARTYPHSPQTRRGVWRRQLDVNKVRVYPAFFELT